MLTYINQLGKFMIINTLTATKQNAAESCMPQSLLTRTISIASEKPGDVSKQQAQATYYIKPRFANPLV